MFSARRRTQRKWVRLLNERGDQRSSYAFISPCGPHVNAADAAYVGTAGKRITIKPAYGNQQAVVQMAAEDLSRSIEAVLCACPFLDQGFDEVVTLGARVRLQKFHSRKR